MVEGLKKGVLGFPSLLAVAVGLVVASTTLVSLSQGMGIAGYGFLLSMLIAWVLMIFQAFTFSELAITMPRAGSISSYTAIALGHFLAIIATIAGYIVVQLLAGPAEIALASIVINKVFLPSVSPTLIGILMLVLFVALNLLGVDVFAKAEIFFTIMKIITIAAIGIAGVVLTGAPQVQNVPPPLEITGIFALVALAVWLLIGVEFTCPLVEEAKNPRRDIPLAMIVGLVIILILNLLFGIACVRFVPMNTLATSPTPHVDVASAILGQVGFYWIGIASFFATAGTINTVLAAVPRMLYGMAHAGQIPSVFKWLHPRFRTPWVGIILLALGMAIQILAGISTIEKIVVFIVASAFSWLLAYIIAHIDAIVIRLKYPNLERLFKTPLFPIPQILGIVGIIFVLMNIFPDPKLKGEIYKYAFYFLGGGAIYSFLWCTFKMKKGLFKPVKYEEALKE
jgi:amino acid transporter